MTSLYESLQSKPMTLIASLPANSYELARSAWENGADAVKIHINVSHRASGTMFKSFEEEREQLERILADSPVPVGLVAGNSTEEVLSDYETIKSQPFDFMSLYLHSAPSEILADKRFTCMMACDYTYQRSEIELFQAMGVDILEASIVHPDQYGAYLNSRDLLRYRQLVQDSGLPVVVPSQKKLRVEDISSIAGSGVKGMMLGAVVTGKTTESIGAAMAQFREAIDRL